MWSKDGVKSVAKQVKGEAERTAGEPFDDEWVVDVELEELERRAEQPSEKARRAAGRPIERVGSAVKR